MEKSKHIAELEKQLADAKFELGNEISSNMGLRERLSRANEAEKRKVVLVGALEEIKRMANTHKVANYPEPSEFKAVYDKATEALKGSNG